MLSTILLTAFGILTVSKLVVFPVIDKLAEFANAYYGKPVYREYANPNRYFVNQR